MKSSFSRQFEEFFFRKEIPYGMALVRILLPAIIFFVMVQRWRFAREFYSADGAPAPLALGYGYTDFLPLMSGNWAVLLFTLMLFLLVTLMIGWKSRLSALGVCLLYTYFTLQDSLGSLTKYSVIASHGFLLLSLSECGAVWSVDRLIELKKNGIRQPLRLLGVGRAVEIWPQRLMQLCLAFIYFGAAVTKLQTSGYFTGDQTRFWMLTNLNHDNPLGEFMTLQPALLVPMMYIALFWEGTFLLLVWKRSLRGIYLATGVLFHVMTTVMLGLVIFPSICLAMYFCFMTQDDLEWWRERVARTVQGMPRLNWLTRLPSRIAARLTAPFSQLGNIGFTVCLICLTLAGTMSERALGVYAGHTPEMFVLQPMPTEQARQMLRNETVIAEQDKLLSFDIGQTLIGGVVVESNQPRFKTGSKLYAQANLIPPHGDLVLECLLINEHGHIHDQNQGIATRESLRYTFPYEISEAKQPGKYQFVLKCNNQEVARKTIEIMAR